MPCRSIVLKNGVRALVCGGRRVACKVCGKPASQECDGPHPARKSATCDAPLCRACSFSPEPGKDYCPGCRSAAVARGEVEPSRPPRDVRLSECRSCGAEIIWAKTESGKSNPVDSLPVPVGNLVLAKVGSTGVVKCELFDEARHQGRNRYVSHFASCSHAAEHRRAKAQQTLELDSTQEGTS